MPNVLKNSLDEGARIKNQKYLLITLVLFLIIPILITFFPAYFRLIFAISFTLLVISGIKTVSDSRRHSIIGMVLGIFSFAFIWINFFIDVTKESDGIKTFFLLAFFSFLAYRLFRKIAFNKTVNLDVIYASISGYLIIGILGGLLFQGLELAKPGSFKLLTDGNNLFDLHYLSFVTLTTLGFGDVTPLSEAAKMLTILVSLAGQLYLTILIAILVGKYLSDPKK